jgi:TolB-like protein/tetratricopeptide (TPR) repeat protein/DNA-binding winged helix-turn-helix (wHTH) protein
MPSTVGQLVRFADFEVDLRAGQLRKQGAKVRLQEQPFRLLTVLLESAGEVVTREELRGRLWPADTFVDFDHRLAAAVSKLRDALADSAENPKFVETVGRRGYRFKPPVDSVGVSAEESSPPGAPNLPVSVEAETKLFFRRTLWIAAVLAVLLVLGFSLWHYRRQPDGTVPHISSIAVLPLENLSNDPEQEYFVEGMTDEIITDLAKLPGIRVISRTSTEQYKGTRKTMPQIARELRVDAVVEGTVLRVGDRVRVRTQLIYAPADRHIWAESYDYHLSDVLALETEFASNIAAQIQVHLTNEQPRTSLKPGAMNPTAFEEYLKGQYFWNRRDGGGLDKAIEHFQRAIDSDPSFAPAYADLAQSYILLDAPERAKSAADKALSLDPTLADAHTALALINEHFWHFPEAEKEYKLAISLNPNYATAHQWYGEGYLALMGRFDEAEREMKQARALDPVSRIIATDCGAVLYLGRRYDEAYRELSNVLEMEPGFSEALMFRGAVLLRQGKYEEAIADLQNASRIDNRPWRLGVLGWALGVAGKRSEATATLRKLKAISRQTAVPPWSFAIIHIGLGEADQAFAWLEKAYSEHASDLRALKVDPIYDPLRSGPRFQDLVRRVGLPP